jgi:hypothetical protein
MRHPLVRTEALDVINLHVKDFGPSARFYGPHRHEDEWSANTGRLP